MRSNGRAFQPIHLDFRGRNLSSLSYSDFLSPFDIRHSSFKMTADMDARLAIDSAVLFLYFALIISIGLYKIGRAHV